MIMAATAIATNRLGGILGCHSGRIAEGHNDVDVSGQKFVDQTIKSAWVERQPSAFQSEISTFNETLCRKRRE